MEKGSGSDGTGTSDEDWAQAGPGSAAAKLQSLAAIKMGEVRQLSWYSCLCCNKEGSSSADTLRPFMARTWETLHKAAEVRQDETFSFLREHHTVNEDGSLCSPKGVYHRSCYSSYTSKSNLQYASRSVSAGSSTTSSASVSPTGSKGHSTVQATRSKLGATDFSKCIFFPKREEDGKKQETK